MDYNQVKDLMLTMDQSTIRVLELTMDNVSIKLSKNNGGMESPSVATAAPEKQAEPIISVTSVTPMAPVAVEESPGPMTILPKEDAPVLEGHIIKSPIVGTFYDTPAPGKPVFVKKGDQVKKGDTICIVEAMKIMNEIKTDVDGQIAEILVSNEAMVEFHQPLFRII